jgi:CRP-like cAMP-binding protein
VNRLIALIPADQRAAIEQHLEPVRLTHGEVLFEPDARITSVFFPLDAVASLSVLLSDGRAAEIATIGNEGMVGLPVFLHSESMPLRAICQIPGDAHAMAAGPFLDACREGRALHEIMHRYTNALFVQIAQSAVCNRLHTLEERTARWLLQTHDRAQQDNFELTQQFLAEVLGVRRASVSEAAAGLQRAGTIDYARGRVSIRDRRGLEKAACECYAVIRSEYERLLR